MVSPCVLGHDEDNGEEIGSCVSASLSLHTQGELPGDSGHASVLRVDSITKTVPFYGTAPWNFD